MSTQEESEIERIDNKCREAINFRQISLQKVKSIDELCPLIKDIYVTVQAINFWNLSFDMKSHAIYYITRHVAHYYKFSMFYQIMQNYHRIRDYILYREREQIGTDY